MALPDSRVIHAKRFLAVHFGKSVGARFFMGGYPLKAEEVFDERFALTPILRNADGASRVIYNRALIQSEDIDETAATGSVAYLRHDVSGTDIFLLVASAEQFFGIAPDAHLDHSIDIDVGALISNLGAAVCDE